MRYILFWLALTMFLGSCTINKDILFKTPTDYEYDKYSDSLQTTVSKITANNTLIMFFFTGDGHMLIENGIGTSVLSNSNGGNGANVNVRNQISYVVDEDGTIKLPVLGRIPIAGLSVREAETYLEQLYTQYYNEPFVVLQINNNRVIVSPGDGGAAKVITLTNDNTTLLEALALAGGVSDRGISSKIKLIRINDETGERDVFLIDLSTIEGISKADLIVQPNDIIYVEPLPLIASGLVQEIAPIITLITTAALLIAIIQAQN